MSQARGLDASPGPANVLASLSDGDLALFEQIVRIAIEQGRFQSAAPSLWRFRPDPSGVGYVSGREIGTAPDGLAGPSRMTAQGHSAFYGSTTKRGAAIEVAKHCGQNVRLRGGRFSPSRSFYYLDVMEPPEPPSMFAPDAADTFDAITFLKRFAKSVSQPNDPSDISIFPKPRYSSSLSTPRTSSRPRSYPVSEQPRPAVGELGCVRRQRLTASTRMRKPPMESAAVDGELYMALEAPTVGDAVGREFVKP